MKKINYRTIIIIAFILFWVWLGFKSKIELKNENESEKKQDKYLNEIQTELKDLNYEIDCKEYIYDYKQEIKKQCTATQSGKPTVTTNYYITNNAASKYYKLDDGKEQKRVGNNNLRILIKEVKTDSEEQLILMYIENTTVRIKGKNNNKEQINNLIDRIVESLE